MNKETMSDKAKIEEAKREAARIEFHERRKLETNEHDFAFLDGYDAAATRWQSIADGLPPVGEYGLWHDRFTGIELYGYLSQKGDVLVYSDCGHLRFAVDKFSAFHPKPAPFTEGETK